MITFSYIYLHSFPRVIRSSFSFFNIRLHCYIPPLPSPFPLINTCSPFLLLEHTLFPLQSCSSFSIYLSTPLHPIPSHPLLLPFVSLLPLPPYTVFLSHILHFTLLSSSPSSTYHASFTSSILVPLLHPLITLLSLHPSQFLSSFVLPRFLHFIHLSFFLLASYHSLLLFTSSSMFLLLLSLHFYRLLFPLLLLLLFPHRTSLLCPFLLLCFFFPLDILLHFLRF